MSGTAVAFGASLTPVRAPLLLNRPQTEEWKGWMQVGEGGGACVGRWVGGAGLA